MSFSAGKRTTWCRQTIWYARIPITCHSLWTLDSHACEANFSLKPTIEHIRGKLRTQIQVDASIKALGEQLASLIETAEKYHFSDKYTSKLDAVSSRYYLH